MEDTQHRRSRSAPARDELHGDFRDGPTRPNTGTGDDLLSPPPGQKLADNLKIQDPPETLKADFKNKKKRSWHTPNIDWHSKKADNSWRNGRVLLIDYIRQDRVSAGKTRVMAQEFQDVHGLHKFYNNDSRCKQAALRVIHVQNAPWAVYYLLQKFHIDDRDNVSSMDFAKWLKHAQPEWRGGKPMLKGKSWRTSRDPWRTIRRTAFGLDYLEPCNVKSYEDPIEATYHNKEAKMMELNDYDDMDNPAYLHDVFVQRLSVYVQYKEKDDAGPIPDVDLRSSDSQPSNANGHAKEWSKGPKADNQKQSYPPLGALDNGNTIIVFENSQTRSVKDTLIGARQQIETRWRRLPFFLPQRDFGNDSRLALECMDLILEDIFKGLAVSWEYFLSIAETHTSILEDKIYDSPADESRAPELWSNSSTWLKVERLLYIHQDIVKTITASLNDISEDEESKASWLDGVSEEYNKLLNLLEEDLIKPTNNLSDLMYKSVGIRDSRHSLQLNTSMWRLSWITFIFLPLTFVVGFFGMNVDTFSGNPSIKWYFIAAVPLMLLVLLLWYLLKHGIAARRQTPYQRGVYEHMFHDMASAHPDLWGRGGPRPSVRAIGAWSKLRWRLLTFWFDPRKTVRKPSADPDEDNGGSGLGSWARFKRLVARRWLNSIKAEPNPVFDAELGEEAEAQRAPALQELVALTSQTGGAQGEPRGHPITAANLKRLSPPPRDSSRASARPDSSKRLSSSGGSSGWMVEERDVRDEVSVVDDTEVWKGVRGSIDGVVNL